MASEPPHPKGEPKEPVPDFEQALSNLSNPELLSALDLALLELEKRLFHYAKVGPELLEMADEGLVLAARAKARLGQSLSAAQHTEGHLQVVGVGEWHPTSTRERTPRDFEVREQGEGTSTLEFSYRIVVKPKDVEAKRLETVERLPERTLVEVESPDLEQESQ
jgi:hypothetical protein